MRRAACTHPIGWARTGGAVQCRTCGTHRFTDYAALRPPGLPEWIRPGPRDRRAADRAAASFIALRRARPAHPYAAPRRGRTAPDNPFRTAQRHATMP
ncbi:DUF6255 family natural product biosynthesis protein [Streptomyces sp. UNOC14_S4]|uniref:DUF6255 family natural product biosynthesis protein n=1 Tax=Streptomyces sp. UNOC14_S4 TaxID=2872340 RepID=UPI0035B34548